MRSPALTRSAAQVCATRLIASVVFRTKTTFSGDGALMNAATFSRASS